VCIGEKWLIPDEKLQGTGIWRKQLSFEKSVEETIPKPGGSTYALGYNHPLGVVSF
jgi:hypothetical protein